MEEPEGLFGNDALSIHKKSKFKTQIRPVNDIVRKTKKQQQQQKSWYEILQYKNIRKNVSRLVFANVSIAGFYLTDV